jgi:hypothetical protein
MFFAQIARLKGGNFSFFDAAAGAASYNLRPEPIPWVDSTHRAAP